MLSSDSTFVNHFYTCYIFCTSLPNSIQHILPSCVLLFPLRCSARNCANERTWRCRSCPSRCVAGRETASSLLARWSTCPRCTCRAALARWGNKGRVGQPRGSKELFRCQKAQSHMLIFLIHVVAQIHQACTLLSQQHAQQATVYAVYTWSTSDILSGICKWI